MLNLRITATKVPLLLYTIKERQVTANAFNVICERE